MAVKNSINSEVRRYILLLALALLAMPYGYAQINVSNTRPLTFGKFVAGSGGTITVDPAGTRSRSGGVYLLASGPGSSATFNASDSNPANANLSYIITLPDNNSVLLSNGSNTMAANNFVSNPSGTGMLTSGSQVISIGATLTVSPNQPPGNYSGNLSITVNYQ